MANPDNRADNVERLQEHIQDTIENLDEAEEYLDEHAEEISETERTAITAKNKRRATSIEGMRSEVKDEAKS